MELLLILLLWLALAVLVGVGANTKGRTGFGYFLLAVIISPLLAGLLVLVLPNLKHQHEMKTLVASQDLANQLALAALPNDVQEKVLVAQTERKRIERNKERVRMMVRVTVTILIVIAVIHFFG